MKVLVIGAGGREHALVRALSHSPSVSQVHACPGSDGMKSDALCHDINPKESTEVISLAKKMAIDLVVIGPENYLAQGLADALRSEGFCVFGPSQNAAELESSKVFAKQFMEQAGVPTAKYQVVSSLAETQAALGSFEPPYVLKADGLAAGKGVFICQTEEELLTAARRLFEENILGNAGRKALLEEFKSGWELSFLVLTNGESFEALPLAQDHKRLLDGGQGPNTGGMGVVAPLHIDPSLKQTILDQIVAPSVRQLQAMGLLYRGVLYIGVMVTPEGPMVLEYNVRFGDPEAQVLLPLLSGDWGEVMEAVAKGNMPKLAWKPVHVACVVLASEGYPEVPKKGVRIEGDPLGQTASSYFLHAGTALDASGNWVTQGGRVLNAIGVGSSLQEAVNQAYQQAALVSWPGVQMRQDIGHQAL